MKLLFDALNIDKAALVGNSYGAFLALNQASLTPQRVSGAVLINPAYAQGRPRATVTPFVESDGVHPGSSARVALTVALPEGLHVQSDQPRDPTHGFMLQIPAWQAHDAELEQRRH